MKAEKTNEKAHVHKPPMQELMTAEAMSDPYSVLKQLRESTPVRYDESRQAWDIFGYEDSVRILKDPYTFSTNLNFLTNESAGENMMTAAPPKHRKLRGMIEKAFTPKAVSDLEPRIRDIANTLLDDVIEQGQMNAVHDFSSPLPIIVIAEMLGVPASDRLKFKEWSDAMVQGVNDASEASYQEVLQKQRQAMGQLLMYLGEVLELRKAEPQDDLISALWQVNQEEQLMSQEELLQFCLGLLVAGNETTANLIASGVRMLSEQPAIQERLINDPTLIPGFVEEVLRYYPPATVSPRKATEDVELGGQQIKAGDYLNVWLMSANRDEAKFPNADVFDLERQPNQHITFGFGIHFCLGAPLARLEAQVAFRTLFERIRNIRFAGTEMRMLPFPMFNSVKEYPITFTKNE